MAHATQTLLVLPDEQRSGLILLRGKQIFDTLNDQQRALPAAREFRELLMLTAAEGSPS